MAILRNREVSILGRTDGIESSPNYTVIYPDLEREIVNLSDLELTDEEYVEMEKQNGSNAMLNVKRIEKSDSKEVPQDKTEKKK